MLPFFENCIKIKRVHVSNAVSMISQKLSLFFFPQSVSLAPLPLRLYIQNAKITNVYVQIKVIGNDSLANRMPVFERKLVYGFDSIVKLITWHIKMLKLVNIMIEVYA